jgi:hypothetical protein
LLRKSGKEQVTYLSSTSPNTEKYCSYILICLLELVVDLVEEVAKMQTENVCMAEECA